MKIALKVITISTALLMMTNVAHALTIYQEVDSTGTGYVDPNDTVTAYMKWKTAVGNTNQQVNFTQTTVITHEGIFDKPQPYYNEVSVNAYNDRENPTPPPKDITYGFNTPDYGIWTDQARFGQTTTTFTFAKPVTSLTAFWDLSLDDFGQGLLFTIIYGNTRTVVGSIIPQNLGGTFGGIDPGFWGFVDATPFDKFEITAAVDPATDPARVFETYTIANLQYGPNAVPELSTLLLIGAGFGGLLCWKRRR